MPLIIISHCQTPSYPTNCKKHIKEPWTLPSSSSTSNTQPINHPVLSKRMSGCTSSPLARSSKELSRAHSRPPCGLSSGYFILPSTEPQTQNSVPVNSDSDLQAHQTTVLRIAIEMKLFDAVAKVNGGEVRLEQLAAATGADKVLTREFGLLAVT